MPIIGLIAILIGIWLILGYTSGRFTADQTTGAALGVVVLISGFFNIMRSM